MSLLIRYAAIITCLLASVALAEVMFEESFENATSPDWKQTWGKVERSQTRARTGKWSIREYPENKYGLSVWYLEFPTSPGAVYTVSAWVFVPAQEHGVIPRLSINRVNWTTLAQAVTKERDTWVRLEVTYKNDSETRLRVQCFQATQAPGIEGAALFWDDIVLERELAPVDPRAGIRINPMVRDGLEVVPAGGMKVRVSPGIIVVGRTEVSVTSVVSFELSPPRLIEVWDEPLVLTDEVPRGYGKGTALPWCRGRGTTVAGCLDPDSLVLKLAQGAEAERYEEGIDWRADKAWGRIGRMPGGRIGATTVAFADYAVSLMRIDTLAVRADGTVVLRRGAEHKMVPEPPGVDMYASALCNIYIPYHCTEITPDLIYPIGPPFPEPGVVSLRAKARLIPRTRAKLANGEDLTVVYWGDSVTCGGDASSENTAFPLAFTNWLRCRFPTSRIRHVNAGTGGWNSHSKLPLFEEQVLAHKPDLVVIELVNDMGFSREMIDANYTDAVGRIRSQGGEVIILTPHFVRPTWMGGDARMRTPETRAAVTYLREFAEGAEVGLADTSRRWEHLWVEGLPYLTLLYNGINHPDDRGHALFVEDLKQFFLATPEESRLKPVAAQDMPGAKP